MVAFSGGGLGVYPHRLHSSSFWGLSCTGGGVQEFKSVGFGDDWDLSLRSKSPGLLPFLPVRLGCCIGLRSKEQLLKEGKQEGSCFCYGVSRRVRWFLWFGKALL